MKNNQPEKQIGTVFTFGERANITASATAIVKGYLAAPGGTYAATTEFAIVIPRNGKLKNLYWTAEKSTLNANGNSITVYVKDPPSLPASSATGLLASWNANAISGTGNAIEIPVNAGATVSIYFQLAKGSGILTRLRVSIELEIDTTEPNPWDLTGTTVSYVAGKVGIGTTNPVGELHAKNIAGTAGVFESTAKILSGTDGVTEKFNVMGNGDVYASGKVGIGTTTPATELEVNGTVQLKGIKLTTGASNGMVLTSDANGNGTWQPTGGAAGTLVGNGTPGCFPKFLAAGELDDSVIYQDGSNIGIGTATPNTMLDVNGAISGFGIVPIGSIIAWHKSFTGTPILPDGWLECNGQPVNDMGSPYYGQALPNLNGEGRFLRGSATSGAQQADAFQGHRHSIIAWGNVAGSHCQEGSGFTINSTIVGDSITDGVNGTPRTANETRPTNMSVVWIIRIK